MDEHAFGAKIRARREEIGLSQNDLAMALRIDQGKVSLIEKGLRKVDALRELPLLAKELRVPIGWLLEGSAAPKAETPVESLIRQYFPDVKFTELEVKRISKFIEPVIQSYVETDPKLSQKASNQ